MLKVKKNSLLMIACLVWGIAGINILRIGLLAYPCLLYTSKMCIRDRINAVWKISARKISDTEGEKEYGIDGSTSYCVACI